ncbi:hypothetical protein RND81_14G122500 [Saponaria officinalis]|uniref:BHLH domain-containing protein n=1 Tax=Saponaria officinalis TaxID=3572 RepID=A0AAW1GPH8_SAPOF
MFPFKRSCEFSFKTDNDNDEDNNSYEVKIEDLENYDLFEASLNNNQDQTRGRGRGRKSRPIASSSNPNNINDEDGKKKVLHREFERQRRQEMSTLFESLSSIIPPENLKGKRSISDHLEEATNYIKDLEKNIKELGEKRDRLKQEFDGRSSGSTLPFGVVIRQFVGGLDIEISVKDDEFVLSNILQVAFEEGLDVVSSTSNKLPARFIHSIQCEVSDVTRVDLNRLEQRLNDLFC